MPRADQVAICKYAKRFGIANVVDVLACAALERANEVECEFGGEYGRRYGRVYDAIKERIDALTREIMALENQAGRPPVGV